MTAQESLERLKEGNSRFVAGKLDGKLQDSSRRDALVGGQSPHAIVLSCADKGAEIDTVVKKNAELTALELMGRSSIIGKAVASGEVKVTAGYYNLDSGRVDFL